MDYIWNVGNMVESAAVQWAICVVIVPDGPCEAREKPPMLEATTYQGEICLFCCAWSLLFFYFFFYFFLL